MTTHLNVGNHLPLNQPYKTGIWAYPGTEALTSIPAQMVKWILLDLRSAPDTAALPVYGRCVIQQAGRVEALIAGDITDDKMLKYSGSNEDPSMIIKTLSP